MLPGVLIRSRFTAVPVGVKEYQISPAPYREVVVPHTFPEMPVADTLDPVTVGPQDILPRVTNSALLQSSFTGAGEELYDGRCAGFVSFMTDEIPEIKLENCVEFEMNVEQYRKLVKYFEEKYGTLYTPPSIYKGLKLDEGEKLIIEAWW